MGRTPDSEIVVAHRPLITVMASLAEAFGRFRGRLPLPVQRRIHALSRNVDDLDALRPSFGQFRVPEELVQTSAGAVTFADDLERVLGDPDRIAQQITRMHPRVPPPLRVWVDRPRWAAERYVRVMHSYHDVVVREIHPNLGHRLRREVHLLQRTIDTEGDARVISRVHPNLSVLGPERVRWVRASGTPSIQLLPDRLVLVPMVSSLLTTMYNGVGRYESNHLHYAYASPNLALFADETRLVGAADPLAALIGPAQARILRRLQLAGTTTDLANDLGLAPSTISHHLRRMEASGTVQGHRHARLVYYRLTDRGRHLLRLYGNPL